MSSVFHQPTKAHFHITKLALDHPKQMFDLGPRLGFAALDFAFGLVEPAAFLQSWISAAPRRDLLDYFTIFVVITVLDAGVTGVCIDRVFFAI